MIIGVVVGVLVIVLVLVLVVVRRLITTQRDQVQLSRSVIVPDEV